MRAFAPITLLACLAACEGTAPTGPRTRTVANSRRAAAGASRGGRRGHGNPPPVDSVRQCPRETSRALARYRANRTLHFGPLCTEVFNGRFSAVMATGTEAEASDVWVLFHDPRGDEVHRVMRFPVGAHIGFGRIVQGWVYLLGRSNALEDMPAGAQLLALFPLPRPGENAPPEIGLLSPLETPLLRATDIDDLDRRLAFPMPLRDPPAREAERAITEIARAGPNTLLDHLSPEGAPTLRAWRDLDALGANHATSRKALRKGTRRDVAHANSTGAGSPRLAEPACVTMDRESPSISLNPTRPELLRHLVGSEGWRSATRQSSPPLRHPSPPRFRR